MKRLIYLSLLIIFSSHLIAQTQWTSNLYTSDFALLGGVQSTMEIMPDAVTTNVGNGTTQFPENSIFSIYSSRTNNPSIVNDPTNVGAWIIVKNPTGTTIFSQKVDIGGSYLKIWSVVFSRPANDNLLVFTGLIGQEDDENGRGTMIIGTYNFTTLVLDIRRLNQISPPSEIASQGVAVRDLDLDNHPNTFMAIGQHGDINAAMVGGSPNIPTILGGTVNPIGVVFDINNSGAISIQHTEIMDFHFKPMSASIAYPKQNSTTGASVYAAGLRILSNPVEVDLDFQTSAYGTLENYEGTVTPAVYTFDANPITGGGWNILVEDGSYLILYEYLHYSFGITWPMIDVIVEEDSQSGDRDVFIAFSEDDVYTSSSQSPTCVIDNIGETMLFFQYDILSNRSYALKQQTKYTFKSSSPDLVYTSFSKLLANHGRNNFEVVFSICDMQNSWKNQFNNRNNTTSIGIMSVPKNDIDNSGSSLRFRSVASDDVVGPNKETEIHGSTGLRVLTTDGTPDKLYLLADSYYRGLNYNRAHFNFSDNGFYLCGEFGDADPLEVNVEPKYENVMPVYAGPTLSSLSPNQQEVDFDTWLCDDYPELPPARLGRLDEGTAEVNRVFENLFEITNTENNVTEYQLFDLSGKQIEIRFSNNRTNLNSLKKGVYILKYKDGTKHNTSKILVL